MFPIIDEFLVRRDKAVYVLDLRDVRPEFGARAEIGKGEGVEEWYEVGVGG